MRLALTPIKPKRNLFDYREYEREIRDAVDEMGDVIVEELEKVADNWDHAPEFRKRLTVRQDTITLDVYPAGENAQIWIYVDLGTRPHPIAAKRGRSLAFKWGGPGSYAPRTTPGGGYGGPGKSSGPTVFPRAVWHPGTTARKFTARILNANKAAFNAAIRDAIREASQ